MADYEEFRQWKLERELIRAKELAMQEEMLQKQVLLQSQNHLTTSTFNAQNANQGGIPNDDSDNEKHQSNSDLLSRDGVEDKIDTTAAQNQFMQFS